MKKLAIASALLSALAITGTAQPIGPHITEHS
jgi:hypothetical protein